MISMIFYSWSRSAALPTYNDILSLCPILMIHSHFSSRVHPDNEENDPGGGFQQQNLRATQSTQVLLEWQFKTQALNSERDLYLARPTFLSIAKCPGKCLLSHNQHLCQHFNRGQDFKSYNDTTGSFKIVWLTHVWNALHCMKSKSKVSQK